MSVLIITLTVSAGSYLTDQKETAAREELETVGNRLANEVTQLDRLSLQGGNVTMHVSHPDQISGASYNAEIATGSDCDTASFSTSSCLVIWSDSLDVNRKMPLNTSSKTDIEIVQGEPGEFALSSTVTGGTSDAVRRASITDLTMRVGVGRDVNPSRGGRVVDPTNEEPNPRFSFEPGLPDNRTKVTFNANGSQDLDGNIVEYQWEFNHSNGSPDRVTTSPTVTWDFDQPGYRSATLTVVDDDAAKSTVVQNVSVSGLVYNNDLLTTSADSLEFTLTNDWQSRDVTITALRIDPKNDDITRLDEVIVDGKSIDTSSDSIPDGGLIVDGFGVDVNPDDTVTVEFRNFEDSFGNLVSMDDEEIQVAVRHDVPVQQTNTTEFTDVVDGPVVSNYELSSTGSGVELSFESNEELDGIEVDLQGDADGNYGTTGGDIDLTRSEFTETNLGSTYRYTATLSGSGSPGTYVAELEAIETTDGTPARNTPITDSLTTSTGFTWQTASDWDDAADQSGFVHANFGGRQADRLQLGYPEFDQGGSNLLTYYPFDGTGSTAVDVTSSGHDGTVTNVNQGTSGIFGNAYEFDGDEGFVEDSDADAYLNGNDELTISAWVEADSVGNNMGIISGGEPDGSDDKIALRHDEEGADGECDSCYKAGVTTSDNSETNVETWWDTQSDDWRHVVFTWDGSSGDLKMYFDGSEARLSSTETGTGTLQDVETLLVGQGPKDEGASDGWDGKIDEVRIYDRVLSDSEAQGLYNARNQGSMTTGWKTAGSTISSNLELEYSADIGSSEYVRVRVQADKNGDGTPEGGSSQWVYLYSSDSGAGTKNINTAGLPSGDTYRLEIEVAKPGLKDESTTQINRLELDT
nr:LamG-like jellyroll fold domain-containing protein [Halorientalis salina]